MIKKIFIGIAIFILPACSLFKKPDIITIASIQEAQSVFESATPQDLFVFDVDDTIIEPIDPTAQARYHDSVKVQLKSDEFKKIREETKAFFAANGDPEIIARKAFASLSIQPIEKEMITAIQDLQKRSVKVIALTRCATGPWGDIKKIEDIRYQELLKVGLNFSTSFGIEEMVFSDLHDTDEVNMHPTYYKGILASVNLPKGIVLTAFLKKINFKPTNIFFFDDQEDNCKSVVEEMKKLGIPCKAFVYRGAFIPQLPFKMNIEVYQLENELMKETNDYVPYQEAEEIFNEQKQSPAPKAVALVA